MFVAGDNDYPGISFEKAYGRITIFKTTIAALGQPPYFRFLLDVEHRKLAIECCEYASSGSHQMPDESSCENCQIKSMDLVQLLYQTCGWDMDGTYRTKGIAIPERKMVVFDLDEADKIQDLREQREKNE